MSDNRVCLICRPKNRTLYYHKNDDGTIWMWCNKCDRGYALHQYCKLAGIDIKDFLEGKFSFEEVKNNEVQALSWPTSFVPLSDPRSAKGVEYVKSRGLTLNGDMYYDMEEEGIVFPYYFDGHFCGAQVRFIEARTKEDGSSWKITTLPGTRLGLLFYGWNQQKFMGNIQAVVVTEGAFNAIAINQALNTIYGGIANNPWRAIACSGAGATTHHREALKELKDQGLKVVLAPDTDEAGKKMIEKYIRDEALTHIALCPDGNEDWNDLLKKMGHLEFAKFFLQSINRYEY
jgi:hypothetical protein